MQQVAIQSESVDIYNINKGNAEFEDMALSEWAKKHGLLEGTDEWAFFAFFLQSLLGVEPGEVSALYFLDYIQSGMGVDSLGSDGPNGAQFMRTRQGRDSCRLLCIGCMLSLCHRQSSYTERSGCASARRMSPIEYTRSMYRSIGWNALHSYHVRRSEVHGAESYRLLAYSALSLNQLRARASCRQGRVRRFNLSWRL